MQRLLFFNCELLMLNKLAAFIWMLLVSEFITMSISELSVRDRDGCAGVLCYIIIT